MLFELAALERGEIEWLRLAAELALNQRCPDTVQFEITLLRLYHVDDLTIDQVGAIYGVHRVTAFRRITRARERLVAGTRRALQTSLAITPTELDSVMRLIHSQLDISVATYLK